MGSGGAFTHYAPILLAASLLSSVAAAAAPSPTRGAANGKTIEHALIDYALQAKLSVGGSLQLCVGPVGVASAGMTVAEALSAILHGSNCTYTMPDAATVIVSLKPAEATATAGAVPAAPVEEVVVTATRRPDLPGSTPYALTAVGGGVISDRRLADMHDLVGQVAGMTVTNLGPGRDKVILRGISDGAFTGLAQSPVAIYLDTSQIAYYAPDPDLRLVDIARVEVLRGPQGALYGGGAIGGVIRIIPNAPDVTAFGGYMKSSVSFTQGGALNNDAVVAANIPLIQDRLAFRGVIYREAHGGYIDDIGSERRKVNNSVRWGGRAALTMMLDEHWQVTLGGAYQSINTADTHYGLRRLPARVRDQVVREPHDNDFVQGRLALEGSGDWGSLTLSATHLSHSFQSRYDATPVMGSFGIRGVGLFDDSKDISLTALEATLVSRRGQTIDWFVGAYASQGETASSNLLTRIFPFQREEYSERRMDKRSETSLYGEVSADLTDNLSLSAGIRIFQNTFDTRSVVREQSGSRSFYGRRVAYGASPKAVLEYDPTDDVILYLQVAGGYRAGGFNTSGRLTETFDTRGGIPREYRPDTIWSYEAGAKVRALHDTLQLRVAAFYAGWQDIPSDQYRASGLPYTLNVGDGISRGLEFEVNWRASEDLDLGVAAIFQESDLTKSSEIPMAGRDLGLPGAPKISSSALFDYHPTLWTNAVLRIQGDISYVGHSFLTFDQQRVFDMGGYFTARLSAGLEIDSYKITLFVNNLTNNAANTFAFGNPFRMRTDPEVTPLTPRTIGIELSASF